MKQNETNPFKIIEAESQKETYKDIEHYLKIEIEKTPGALNKIFSAAQSAIKKWKENNPEKIEALEVFFKNKSLDTKEKLEKYLKDLILVKPIQLKKEKNEPEIER